MKIWIQALLNPKASSLNLQKERLQQAGNIEAFTFTFTLIGMILFRALSRFRALFDGDGPSAQNRDTTVHVTRPYIQVLLADDDGLNNS